MRAATVLLVVFCVCAFESCRQLSPYEDIESAPRDIVDPDLDHLSRFVGTGDPQFLDRNRTHPHPANGQPVLSYENGLGSEIEAVISTNGDFVVGVLRSPMSEPRSDEVPPRVLLFGLPDADDFDPNGDKAWFVRAVVRRPVPDRGQQGAALPFDSYPPRGTIVHPLRGRLFRTGPQTARQLHLEMTTFSLPGEPAPQPAGDYVLDAKPVTLSKADENLFAVQPWQEELRVGETPYVYDYRFYGTYHGAGTFRTVVAEKDIEAVVKVKLRLVDVSPRHLGMAGCLLGFGRGSVLVTKVDGKDTGDSPVPLVFLVAGEVTRRGYAAVDVISVETPQLLSVEKDSDELDDGGSWWHKSRWFRGSASLDETGTDLTFSLDKRQFDLRLSKAAVPVVGPSWDANDPPQVTIVAPQPGQGFAGVKKRIELEAEVTDPQSTGMHRLQWMRKRTLFPHSPFRATGRTIQGSGNEKVAWFPAETGEYVLRFEAMDRGGLIGTAEVTVDVGGQPPGQPTIHSPKVEINAAVTEVFYVNEGFTFSGIAHDQEDGYIPLSPGTRLVWEFTGPQNASITREGDVFTLAFPDVGDWTMKVTAYDTAGLASDPITRKLQVRPADGTGPPVVRIVMPDPVNPQQLYAPKNRTMEFVGSIEPAPGDTGIAESQWTITDITEPTLVVVKRTVDNQTSFTHQFEDLHPPHRYSVRLRARGNNGVWGDHTLQFGILKPDKVVQ